MWQLWVDRVEYMSGGREELTGLCVAAALTTVGAQGAGSFTHQPVVLTPTTDKTRAIFFQLFWGWYFHAYALPNTPDAFFPVRVGFIRSRHNLGVKIVGLRFDFSVLP